MRVDTATFPLTSTSPKYHPNSDSSNEAFDRSIAIHLAKLTVDSNSVKSHMDTLNAEIVTNETIRSRKDWRRIRERLLEYVEDLMSAFAAVSQDDDDEADSGIVMVKDFQIQDIDTFELLQEKFPQVYKNYYVVVDFENGHLWIKVRPGDLHAAASGAWDYVILYYSNNGAPPIDNPVLQSTRDANYRYAARNSKSPDSSYTPRDAVIPPAVVKPGIARPGCRGIPYPNLVLEFAHRNESYHRLKRDTRTKSFALCTGIRIVVAVKIFKGHFQAFWATRSPVGSGMHIQAETPKMDVNIPTNEQFNIPGALIFFSCANIPPLPTPNLILRMETMRIAIKDKMG